MITVIVLMILAGVSLSFVLGDNGILKKAQESADAYKNKAGEESNTLDMVNGYLENMMGNTTGGGSTNPPTTNKISKSTSYVGYYADIDADGTVDGVIYADLAKGDNVEKKWHNDSDSKYTIPTVTEGLKDYYISQESYTGNFGKKAVISPTGTGTERFYIMALTDIDGTRNGKIYDWYNAADDKGIRDWSTITSEDFGTGKTNTATMIAKWNAKEYGDQDTCSSHKDMWGQIQTKVKDGWFVPSRAEWAAFAGELGINYANFGLSYCYWSSSLRNAGSTWCLNIANGCMVIRGINVPINYGSVNYDTYVRLGATF